MGVSAITDKLQGKNTGDKVNELKSKLEEMEFKHKKEVMELKEKHEKERNKVESELAQKAQEAQKKGTPIPPKPNSQVPPTPPTSSVPTVPAQSSTQQSDSSSINPEIGTSSRSSTTLSQQNGPSLIADVLDLKERVSRIEGILQVVLPKESSSS